MYEKETSTKIFNRIQLMISYAHFGYWKFISDS